MATSQYFDFAQGGGPQYSTLLEDRTLVWLFPAAVTAHMTAAGLHQ
ncbi:ZFR2 isoform 5, partial [Pongo abelii]